MNLRKILTLSIPRFLTRLYPFQFPRTSILSLLPKVPHDCGSIQVQDGLKYVAYPSSSDYIIRNLFWFGNFEPWVSTVIKTLVRPGDIVCDIGANIGDTALSILPSVGSLGKIYCFEPIPSIHSCLVENLTANNISNVIPVSVALSNRTGQFIMEIPLGEPGQSRVSESSQFSIPHQKVLVDVTTFDKWLRDRGVSQIAACKVDVEGHELEVFEGMKDTLAAGRIGSIVFERHQYCNDADPVVQLLQHHHYRIFRIYKGLRRVTVIELQEKPRLLETPDYVAVLKNSSFEQRLYALQAASIGY